MRNHTMSTAPAASAATVVRAANDQGVAPAPPVDPAVRAAPAAAPAPVSYCSRCNTDPCTCTMVEKIQAELDAALAKFNPPPRNVDAENEMFRMVSQTDVPGFCPSFEKINDSKDFYARIGKFLDNVCLDLNMEESDSVRRSFKNHKSMLPYMLSFRSNLNGVAWLRKSLQDQCGELRFFDIGPVKLVMDSWLAILMDDETMEAVGSSVWKERCSNFIQRINEILLIIGKTEFNYIEILKLIFDDDSFTKFANEKNEIADTSDRLNASFGRDTFTVESKITIKRGVEKFEFTVNEPFSTLVSYISFIHVSTQKDYCPKLKRLMTLLYGYGADFLAIGGNQFSPLSDKAVQKYTKCTANINDAMIVTFKLIRFLYFANINTQLDFTPDDIWFELPHRAKCLVSSLAWYFAPTLLDMGVPVIPAPISEKDQARGIVIKKPVKPSNYNLHQYLRNDLMRDGLYIVYDENITIVQLLNHSQFIQQRKLENGGGRGRGRGGFGGRGRGGFGGRGRGAFN